MLRDVVMKLRNMENLGGNKQPKEQQKELSMMPIKMSRLTSAASSRVGPIKIDVREELSNEKGNNVEKPYGIWAKLMAEFSGDLFLVLISGVEGILIRNDWPFLGSLSALGSDAINGRLHAGLATGLVIFVLITSVGQIRC